MTSGQHHPKPNQRPDAQEVSRQAAMENFVRLQQSQEEYLKWLDASFKRPDVDSYIYKKIR